MIWAAWRLQRHPAAILGGLLALFGVLAAAAALDPELGLILQLAGPAQLCVVMCLFWGAPLIARELENGTHRLAWTQSHTRAAWLTSRLAVAVAAALTATALLVLLIHLTQGTPTAPLTWYAYESSGPLPYTRVLFALALGLALGALTRHTQLAMAISLPLLSVLQLGGAQALRSTLTLDPATLRLSESALYLTLAAALTAATYLRLARIS